MGAHSGKERLYIKWKPIGHDVVTMLSHGGNNDPILEGPLLSASMFPGPKNPSTVRLEGCEQYSPRESNSK